MKRASVVLIILLFSSLLFSQSVISVAPGEGTLTTALANAVDGDVFELVPGAVYTESSAYVFGSIVDKSITIGVEGDDPEKAVLQILTPPDGESTIRFFDVGNNASLTLEELEIDGGYGGVPNADYAVTFYMGEFPAPTTINTIRVDNCYIHDFVSDVIAAGNTEMRGNVIVDSTLVNNCVIERTGTTIYYKYCGAHYISLKNSTLNTINSYGFRVAGPLESNFPLDTPSVDIDHTTWYNIGTEDSREIIQCEKGPHLGQWHVSNSIFVKQVEKSRTVINIKELVTAENGVINNICLWDVGKRAWHDQSVTDTLNVDPLFADPDNGDFTLPAGSPLLTFASDGSAVGDPRWAANAPSAVEDHVEMPHQFELAQNFPNPFNPSTTITFMLTEQSETSLAVYDLLGHKVAQLVNGTLTAGEHRFTFRAHDLASGIYFYELRANNQIAVKKMTVLE